MSEIEQYDPQQAKWLESLKKSGFNSQTEVVIPDNNEPQFNKVVKIHICEVPSVPLDKGTSWTCPCGVTWRVRKCTWTKGSYGTKVFTMTWKKGWKPWGETREFVVEA